MSDLMKLHDLKIRYPAAFAGVEIENGKLIVPNRFQVRRIAGKLSSEVVFAFGYMPEITIPEKPKEGVQLPLWPEPTRGTPNSFLRSALFAGIQGKTRKYLEAELLGSQANYEVKFTGQQLVQSDLDVWEQIIHLSRDKTSAGHVIFKGHAFLKALGRSTGGRDRKWLHKTITRLIATAVEIRSDKYFYIGPLLKEAAGNEVSDLFAVEVNENLLKLYTSSDFTAIEWKQRIALKGKPLALWLHGYFASHREPYPVKAATIRELSGSRTQTLKHFKAALKRASIELEKVTGWKLWIEEDLLHCKKTPHLLS